jgi:hypothetical protein
MVLLIATLRAEQFGRSGLQQIDELNGRLTGGIARVTRSVDIQGVSGIS